MAVFGSREAAEEFVRDDPFVNEGVVKGWTLREWDEVATRFDLGSTPRRSANRDTRMPTW
jgi:hypothetical protein